MRRPALLAWLQKLLIHEVRGLEVAGPTSGTLAAMSWGQREMALATVILAWPDWSGSLLPSKAIGLGSVCQPGANCGSVSWPAPFHCWGKKTTCAGAGRFGVRLQ